MRNVGGFREGATNRSSARGIEGEGSCRCEAIGSRRDIILWVALIAWVVITKHVVNFGIKSDRLGHELNRAVRTITTR